MRITLQRDHARSMRKNMTGAERKLWSSLKGRALKGYRFNRQVEIGPYIADFLCRECCVIVEVDGATHGTAHEVQNDGKRSAYLQSKGFVVFRVWNTDVYCNLNGVLDAHLETLENRT